VETFVTNVLGAILYVPTAQTAMQGMQSVDFLLYRLVAQLHVLHAAIILRSREWVNRAVMS
jgi:hypothetical protein